MPGCALHPRSRVQNAREKTHTSIQVSGDTPTFPAQGKINSPVKFYKSRAVRILLIARTISP